jgi:hypothetical protein
MSKDLTHYNELLQEARTATIEKTTTIAKTYVPKMYAELKNLGYEPYLARTKIEIDCKSMWLLQTIRDALPDEAKDSIKQESAYKSVEVRKMKRQSEVKYWIPANHETYGRITEAFIASSDGNFRIGVNAKYDFVRAEPVTPKSVTTEPLTVKSVSSAPVRS